MRTSWIAAFVVVGILFMASQGLAYTKIKCFMLQLPLKPLPGVKRIAILDFEGPVGRLASDKLISILLQDKRGISLREGRTYQMGVTTKIFDIIGQTRLNLEFPIVPEQHLGQSGINSHTHAAKLGKAMGVDAVITGSVSSVHNYISTTRREKMYGSQNEGGEYETTVSYSIPKVTVIMSMQIVSVETGQILGNKYVMFSKKGKIGDQFAYKPTSIWDVSHEDEKNKYAYQKIGASVDDSGELLADAVSSAAWDLSLYFSPHFSLVEMELKKVKGKQYENKADEAEKLAEKGELNKAYLIYDAIYQENPHNPEILYNLGVLNEIVGNFADAKAMYENALSLKSNKKEYQAALVRVQKVLDFMPVTKHEWITERFSDLVPMSGVDESAKAPQYREWLQSRQLQDRAVKVRLMMVMVSSEAEGEALLLHVRSGTAFQGQDIGFVLPTDLDPRFAEAVKGLKAGEISAVVRTEKGFFLFKRTE